MSDVEILHEFKTQMLIFLDELISQFPREGDFILMRVYSSHHLNIEETVKEFLYELNKNNGKVREAFKERNEMYFLSMEVSQRIQQKYKILYFKKIWRSGALDLENKRTIWAWFDTFIYLADKYFKCTQKEN